MDVSIIIVNYNTRELLQDCLESIYRHTMDINFEVIVSDNGSEDGSIEMLKQDFPQVVLIENNANLGFGRANNRGLAIAKGKYIFYLNSDTILLNNAVKIFYDYWENSPEKESIGALGCNLQDGEGNVTHSWANFPDCNTAIIDLIRLNYGMIKLCCFKILGKKFPEIATETKVVKKKIGEVDFIIGADLFLKNDNNAFFDEAIFLYTEEVDLQFQLKKENKKRLLIDGPIILHLEGASSKKFTNSPFPCITSFAAKCKNISRVYYFRKNTSCLKSVIVKILTVILWLNPLVIRYTYRSLGELIRR